VREYNITKSLLCKCQMTIEGN